MPAFTDAERLEIAHLQEITSESAFARAVTDWLRKPDPDGSGARVFSSPELMDRTNIALKRLDRQLEGEIRRANHDARPGLEMRRRHIRNAQTIVKAAIEARKKQRRGITRKYYEILAQRHHREWAQIRHLMKAGYTPEEVKARLDAEDVEGRP